MLFRYKNQYKKQVVNEKDEPVFEKNEDGSDNKAQPVYETVEVDEVFNVNCVINALMVADGKLLVRLNDGHEETEARKKLKDPKKAPTPNNIIIDKTRVWKASEILLEGEDVTRFLDLAQ